jgi:hypothetical protein
MQKISNTQLAFGLALIALAVNLYPARTFADDLAQSPSTEMRPPQVNSMDTSPTVNAAPAPGTARVLGTLSPSDVAVAPSSSSPEEHVQPKQAGDVIYVTGGIGDEERSALKAMEKDYNLHIMIAAKTGQFVADSRVVIRNGNGDEVLDTVAGPLFYAKLPAGQYTVEASNEGKSAKQKVMVGKGNPASIYFSW